MKSRSDVLEEAKRLIAGDRQDAYGDPGASFGRIGRLWSEVLGVTVTPQQVALCMVLLKVSRAVSSPEKTDSFVDMAGYAALAAEVGVFNWAACMKAAFAAEAHDAEAHDD